MIKDLFETHINVTDLERSMKFYEETLELEFGLKEEGRRVAFYWIGERGQAMLGLWEQGPAQVFPQHFAFEVTVEDMRKAVAYLKSKDLKAHNFLKDGIERPMVFGWMPAVAIYFNDPDGHSLEFIAMLPDEPKPEVGVVSWEEWDRLNNTKGLNL